jgi:hypothetical protein
MTQQHIDKEAFYNRIVGFFDQRILAVYKSEPDKYVLETDNFEGTLRRVYDDDDYAIAEDHIDIRFGYRTLASGNLALAVFLPDLVEKSASHVKQWAGYHLESPEWTTEPDPRFKMWKDRYLEGSWNVENGPRYHLENTIATINALCIEVVGKALFTFPNNPALNFPVAQNTYAYQDAHKELYSYVIDGLDKQTIGLIAAHQHVMLNLNSDTTVKALKRALPLLPTTSLLWDALEKVSDERRLAGHKVRPKAKQFPAFEEFTKDLEAVVVGLGELLATLEKVLGMDGERACKRQSTKKWLPRIDRPPEAHYAITKLPAIIGKTVERVEFGFREHVDGAHQSEAMILYFTDGSILGIDTGSNAGNLASQYEGLRPDDFHADFMLYWVPPPK